MKGRTIKYFETFKEQRKFAMDKKERVIDYGIKFVNGEKVYFVLFEI